MCSQGQGLPGLGRFWGLGQRGGVECVLLMAALSLCRKESPSCQGSKQLSKLPLLSGDKSPLGPSHRHSVKYRLWPLSCCHGRLEWMQQATNIHFPAKIKFARPSLQNAGVSFSLTELVCLQLPGSQLLRHCPGPRLARPHPLTYTQFTVPLAGGGGVGSLAGGTPGRAPPTSAGRPHLRPEPGPAHLLEGGKAQPLPALHGKPQGGPRVGPAHQDLPALGLRANCPRHPQSTGLQESGGVSAAVGDMETAMSKSPWKHRPGASTTLTRGPSL